MKNGAMKNKLDFILKVEEEGAFGTLNRLTFRRFDSDTVVWSDSASHNTLLFVTDGEALYSGGYGDEAARETTLHRKVTVLPAGAPFTVEFRAGCEVLAYPFDGYPPMDETVYAGVVGASECIAGQAVAADITRPMERELVEIIRNIVSVGANETLTLLAMRKVTAVMQKSLGAAVTARLFATGGPELGGEIFRYMKIAENRANITKKSANVIF